MSHRAESMPLSAAVANPLLPSAVKRRYMFCQIRSIWLGSWPTRPSEKSVFGRSLRSISMARAIKMAPPPPELVASPTPVIPSSVSISTNTHVHSGWALTSLALTSVIFILLSILRLHCLGRAHSDGILRRPCAAGVIITVCQTNHASQSPWATPPGSARKSSSRRS